MFNIRGKNIIVTGSRRSIGLKIAAEIRKIGTNLIRIEK